MSQVRIGPGVGSIKQARLGYCTVIPNPGYEHPYYQPFILEFVIGSTCEAIYGDGYTMWAQEI